MRIQWSKVRWGRGVLVGILAPVVSFLAVTLTVFIYAFVLGFQARGMPDVERIGRFAQSFAPWAAPVLTVLLTLGGAFLVARRAKTAALESGLLAGLVAAVVGLAMSLVPHLALSWEEVVWFVLSAGAGLLGGYLATIRRSA